MPLSLCDERNVEIKAILQKFYFRIFLLLLSETRQNGLQNNWLLKAYITNIQEIEQNLQSISHTKHHHKMCGYKSQKKLSKVT